MDLFDPSTATKTTKRLPPGGLLRFRVLISVGFHCPFPVPLTGIFR